MKSKGYAGQGKDSADWGFTPPSDGWHMIEFQEGIAYLEKDGKVLEDKKGKKLIAFPAVIKEDGTDDDGKKVSVIVAEGTDFGEQKVADILVATELFEKFEQHFPGDVSVFDSAPWSKIVTSVPGKFAKIKIEASKDGKFANIVGLTNVKTKVEEKPKESGKGAAKEEKKAPANQDW